MYEVYGTQGVTRSLALRPSLRETKCRSRSQYLFALNIFISLLFNFFADIFAAIFKNYKSITCISHPIHWLQMKKSIHLLCVGPAKENVHTIQWSNSGSCNILQSLLHINALLFFFFYLVSLHFRRAGYNYILMARALEDQMRWLKYYCNKPYELFFMWVLWKP